MARLNEEQIMGIKEHMCSDEKKLASLYRAKKKSYDECSVSFNEAEERKKQVLLTNMFPIFIMPVFLIKINGAESSVPLFLLE